MTARQLFRLKRALADSPVGDRLVAIVVGLEAELREEGLDPEKVAADMRAAFERVFAKPVDNSAE